MRVHNELAFRLGLEAAKQGGAYPLLYKAIALVDSHKIQLDQCDGQPRDGISVAQMDVAVGAALPEIERNWQCLRLPTLTQVKMDFVADLTSHQQNPPLPTESQGELRTGVATAELRPTTANNPSQTQDPDFDAEMLALRVYTESIRNERQARGDNNPVGDILCPTIAIPQNTRQAEAEIMRLGLEVLSDRFLATLKEYDDYIIGECEKPDWHIYHEDFVVCNSANLAECWIKGEEWKINYLSPGMRMRRIMAERSAPYSPMERAHSRQTIDLREITARQTLRAIVGEHDYHMFLRKGFMTVRGASGRSYMIFPGHGFTTVYQTNKPIERLCVVLQGDFCPTDALLMRYVLILNDENEFRKLANVHPVYHGDASDPRRDRGEEIRSRSLVDLFRSLKTRRHCSRPDCPICQQTDMVARKREELVA